jgi:hypothetical protein
VPSPPIWKILGLIGLFFVIATTSVIDPRPRALDRLRESLDHIFNPSNKDK